MASSENTGFFFVFLALDFGFFERILLVVFDFGSNIFAGELRNKRVFWRQSQECHTKNRIWSRGENFDFFTLSFAVSNFEFDFSAFGFSNPVSLHYFDFFGPIKLVDIFQKFVRISCNFEKPLRHFLFRNFFATAPTLSGFYLFIRKNGFVVFTPPLIRIFSISQAFSVHLPKNPLCPAIIFRIRSVNFATPIDRNSKPFELSLEIVDIFARSLLRRNSSFDCVIFGRQTKSIPTDRI